MVPSRLRRHASTNRVTSHSSEKSGGLSTVHPDAMTACCLNAMAALTWSSWRIWSNTRRPWRVTRTDGLYCSHVMPGQMRRGSARAISPVGGVGGLRNAFQASAARSARVGIRVRPPTIPRGGFLSSRCAPGRCG